MNKQFLIAVFIFVSINVKAQNIPVGSVDMLETRFRNEQILGTGDSLVSFCLRPLLNRTQTDSSNLHKKSILKALPIQLTQQYNSYAPSGWNDGAMIPAKGYQTLITAGFYSNYGPVHLQLKPEYVYAQNPSFETFPLNETNRARQNHIFYLNYIDNPERLGEKSYSKLFWGQSSLSVDIYKFSVGVSTENMWWGPGQRNSLIMSNNAPGFLHATFNTKKPISTFLGSFEGQIISGKIHGSGLDVSDADYIIDGINYKNPKLDEWRYINGLTITYQPKWVPGLFVGLNRIFQIYNNELGHGFSDYFPTFTPFQKKNLAEEDAKSRDQLASIFLRWVFKESNTEIYFENLWNDHAQDINSLIDKPSNNAAYLIGFTKIFKNKYNKDNYFKFNFEHSQIQQGANIIASGTGGSSYVHGLVRHGYTNQSQVIGAGVGPGGNSQTFDFSAWKKESVLGIQLERFAHNLDFYMLSYDENYHRWVDRNINIYIYKRFGKLGIQAKLNTSYMHNYQWQASDHHYNLHAQVTLQYHL